MKKRHGVDRKDSSVHLAGDPAQAVQLSVQRTWQAVSGCHDRRANPRERTTRLEFCKSAANGLGHHGLKILASQGRLMPAGTLLVGGGGAGSSARHASRYSGCRRGSGNHKVSVVVPAHSTGCRLSKGQLHVHAFLSVGLVGFRLS